MQRTLLPATIDDIPSLVHLINSAYRGESGKIGWTTESDLLGGQRTGIEQLREVMKCPHSTILVLRPGPTETIGSTQAILGCVLVKHLDNGCAYLGMLTVNVNEQAAGLGRQLIEATEDYAKTQFNANKIEMTVIGQREELISWYERRGYRKSGERRPFPYGDENAGIPLRPDLYFEVLTKSI